jgi:outer membrane lipoprotein-sorting protein
MSKDERVLSEYIDRLNAEKRPVEHGNKESLPELEKLFDTVRLVRSLKEPAMPEGGYSKRLARDVAEGLKVRRAKKPQKTWLMGSVAAAVILLAVLVNFILPFGDQNIVYAMEQAFKEVKAYHGVLEISELNAEGEESTQAKLEVWADKEGRYYIKQLEGTQKGMVTANNGQKKWQLRPEQKEAYLFSAFPDPYKFIFEMGKEVKDAGNALNTKVIGEDTVSGRKAHVLEITPQGGIPYKLWVDNETRLPLQKMSGMQNALQYRVTYEKIDFIERIPLELTSYSLPAGYKEIGTKQEQLAANLSEAAEIAGFIPRVPEILPGGYSLQSISVEIDSKTIKLSFVARDKTKRLVLLESMSLNDFQPAAAAVLGKIGNSTAEVQSPVQNDSGILGGGGPYAGITDINSIRWQMQGIEYAVVGNVLTEELAEFIESLDLGRVSIPDGGLKQSAKPQIEVPVDKPFKIYPFYG